MTRKLSIIGLLGVLLLLSVPATWAQEGAASPGNGQPTPGVAEVLPVDGAQQIDPRTPITIVFNRPIVPLTILEEREDLPNPLNLMPDVPGEGEWINTSIYVFRPDQALAGGTNYLGVIEGVRDANGEVVMPFSWSFTTVYPQVTSVTPNEMASDVALGDPVTVSFNQPMDEVSVEAAFTLINGEGTQATPVEGTFRWSDDSTQMTFDPNGQLALDTLYQIALDAEQAQAAVGEATLASGFDTSFLTVPPPAIVGTSPQDGATGTDIFGGLSLEFVSDMNPATIREHITIEPTPPGGAPTDGFFSSYNNRYRLNFSAEANTTYTVTIEPGMEDVYGNAIERELTFMYTTRNFRPEYSLQIPGEVGFYNAFNQVTELYLAYRNVTTVDLTLHQIQVDNLVGAMTDDNYETATNYDLSGAELVREWQIDASGVPQNTRRFNLLDVGATGTTEAGALRSCDGAMPSRVAPGDIATVITDPDPLRARSEPPSGEIVDLLYNGYQLTIADGPRCIDGIPWFQVELRDGTLVWIAESVDDEYFIELRAAAQRTPVQVTGEDGALAPGAYFLQVSSPDPDAYSQSSQRHVMLVSSATVTVKYTVNGALAWVTNVDTGEPLAGVPVSFFGDFSSSLGTATTDERGVARLDYERRDDLFERLVAVVDTGEQFGMGYDNWTRGIQPYEFNVATNYNPDDLETYLYTDRPIYRPDQPVYFRGVVRTKNDVTYTPPPFDDVDVNIYDDQNNLIYEQALALDEYGAFDDELMLAEDAVLGSFYRIEVLNPLEDRARSLETLYFSVAEFRTPEFQVEATAQTDEVLRGDDLRVMVDAQYFSGGSVSDARVDYAVEAQPYTFNYEGEGRYSFRDVEPYTSYQPSSFGQRILDGSAETDTSGQAMLSLSTTSTQYEGSQRYTVETTVSDESGFPVSDRTTAVVHASSVYVGVGVEGYVGRVGEATTANIIAVDWDSLPVADQSVDVTIEEWRWNTVQEVDDQGRVVYRSEVEQIEVATDTVTTDDDGQATYEFTPESGGLYRIETTTRDADGNEVTSARLLWVSGRNYVSWRQENDRTIELVADADDYDVGDTAEILITSPFQGEAQALVTVEREGVLQTETVTLDSNSYVYELPITEDFAPNVFVGVMLVKGVDEDNPVASFRYGMTSLNVETERKVLTIEAEPDVEQAEPQETVTYTIRTTDYRGEPVSAQVGLGLTDLAVLSITGPNSGPILDRFYGSQALSVLTSTPLTINTDEITQNIEEVFKGGGGGGGAAGVFEIRGDFVTTPYWNPDLVTDEDGTATVEVTLPDNLTTWRLDARGFTLGEDDTFLVGQNTFDLVSTKPLLVRPATPRFFVVGDEVMLSAVVNNNTGEEQDVTSFVEATGLAFTDGDAEQTQTVPAGGRARFAWPVTVQDVENVDVTFFASADDGFYTDASKPAVGLGDERLLPVYRFDVPETVGTAGTLSPDEPSVTETIQLPQTMEVVNGTLDVNVDTSLAGTTLDGLDYLRNYERQSISATVSKFLPNVVTYDALQQFGAANEAMAETLDEEVSIGLQTLNRQQKMDGGWGWYPQDESNPLVTAYALLGLVEAQNAGYPVADEVIGRARQYLLDNPILAGVPAQGGFDWEYDREAFVLYVLARADAAPAGRMANLFDNRARLNAQSEAFLALAFHNVLPGDERINTLMADVRSGAAVSASGTFWSVQDRYNWTTDTRATSVILQAMVAIDPDSELIPNVVRYLVSARTADHWETTQETAWAVMGLTDWMVASQELTPDYDFSVTFNGDTLLEDTATPDDVTETRRMQVTVAEMLQDTLNELTIERTDGPGMLYYTSFLEAYLPVPEVEAVSNGISVSRRYLDADGEPVTSANVGDIVEVRLTVVVPNSLHYVTIEDPIPAGTEAINPDLDTSAQIGTRPGLDRLDVDRYGWGWWWFSNIEFRDEQVVLSSTFLPSGTYEYVYSLRASVPGTYNVIPATAQETYFPDVYGRSAGETFTVTPTE